MASAAIIDNNTTTLAAEAAPPLPEHGVVSSFPPAPFAGALSRPAAVRLPQAIAHRGYKAAWPENTLPAFRAAVEAGAHAIETDLHLSRDKVVVLSHDKTLKRCFGRPERVADCDWALLSTLRTLRAPHSPPPRLLDLLAYLAEPGLEHVWLLLDLKRDDDPADLALQIAATFAAAPAADAPGSRPWQQRVLVGCWSARLMGLCREHLPGFPVAHIGFSVPYARHLLGYGGVALNMYLGTVAAAPLGGWLLRAARERGRAVFVWTVDEEEWMEWCVRRGVDGVVTDDPKLFREVCRRWEEEQKEQKEQKQDGAPGGLKKTAAAARSGGKRKTSLARWIRLYGVLLLLQIPAHIVIAILRLINGSHKKQIQRALGPPAA